MTEEIEVTATWKIIDRWWTDEPVVRYWAALRSPSVDYDVRVAVCYDETTREWSLHPEQDVSA